MDFVPFRGVNVAKSRAVEPAFSLRLIPSIRRITNPEWSREGCTMPTCENCDSFVTENYVRVFAPEGRNSVRVCPGCQDKIRDGAEIRTARSTRQQ